MRYIIFISIFWITSLYAQYPAGHIPDASRQDWNEAGLTDKSEPRIAQRIINFKTDSIAGIGENDEKIAHILDRLTEDKLTVIYFPEGEYNFYGPIIINKNNIVLQGDGSAKTKFYFHNSRTEPCIAINGRYFGTAYAIEGPVRKGSRILTPQRNITSIVNRWVHFYDPHDGYGQISKVVDIGTAPSFAKIKRTSLTLKDKATKNYNESELRIAAFTPCQNVGIENLRIEKITDGKGDGGSSIYFTRAVNCWVRGVESAYTSEHHIRLNYSSHIEISGNYFHHAHYYGEGGFGYGVNIQANSTNNLVENNIFKHLRHSLALQKGANCNVISYNYSYDRRSFNDDIISPENESCDLVLHGNYAWGNLFEQNNVAAIAADNTHGENGPYNAFIRNKARGDGIIALEPGWYPLQYGLVLYKTPQTTLMGNMIRNNDIEYDGGDIAVNIFGRETADGTYEDWPDIRHKGSTYNKAKDDPNLYYLYDISYYYSERPDFIPDGYTFPSLGPKPGSGIELTQSIPAEGRVENDSLRTFNIHPTEYHLDITIITKTDENIDTTIYNQLNIQPFKVVDTLIHPLSGEKYFFAGIEASPTLDFNNITKEIRPQLFQENIYTLVYKKIQRTSKSEAYMNNNQRKLVKDSDGSLYNLYESMGHLFLEYKNASGYWRLLSDNKTNLFIDSHGAGSPAMDYAKQDNIYNNLIAITYQEKNTIRLKTIIKNDKNPVFGPKPEQIVSGIDENKDVHPNLAWGGQGVFLVLWQDSTYNPGINYKLLKFNGSFTELNAGILAGSNDSSGNTAVSAWYNDSTQTNYFDVVWEQKLSATTNSLYHTRVICNPDGSTLFNEARQISKNTFEKNTNATVVSLPEGAIVTWLMGYNFNGERPEPARTVLRNAVTMGDFYFYDKYTESTAINKFNDNSGYYFGWSKYYLGHWYNYFVISDRLSRIRRDFLSKANEFQLSNSADINDITAMAFYHTRSPYYFQSFTPGANNIESIPVIINESKGFTFSKYDKDFDYLVSDIRLNQQPIDFSDVLPGIPGNILLTQDFYLPENMQLQFDEGFGLSVKDKAAGFFTKNDWISVKIELVDQDNNVLDSIRKIDITRENLHSYNAHTFTYKNTNIKNLFAKIRITFDTNIRNINLSKMNYYLSEKTEDENIDIKEVRGPAYFALKQNYPNPFNPLTRIAYQVAHKSIVSLKIYDILGREVHTLVNEEKDAGEYSAIFNAVDLAAGVYIVKMQAGNFSNARKIILIK